MNVGQRTESKHLSRNSDRETPRESGELWDGGVGVSEGQEEKLVTSETKVALAKA
jgi:hypothetical protein